MSKKSVLAVVIAVVVVVVVGGGLWWFLRNDAPQQVSLSAATEQVEAADGATGSTTTPGSVDGTWDLDIETGTFDYTSATGSFAGFRVEEELANIGSTTAVGRTGEVTGSLTIAGNQLTAAEFTVDMTSITTDEARRDNRVQQALETGQFPTATFTLTEPVDLGSGAASGSPVSATASGEFTAHGVTRPVQVPIEAQLVDGTIVVVGSFSILFTDYGVTPPSAPIVLSVADNATVEFQLLFVKP